MTRREELYFEMLNMGIQLELTDEENELMRGEGYRSGFSDTCDFVITRIEALKEAGHSESEIVGHLLQQLDHTENELVN